MAGNALTQSQAPGTWVAVIGTQGNQEALRAPFASDASELTYTPQSLGNWPLTPPADVAEALDGLALIAAGSITNAGAIGAAATNTFSNPSLVSSFKSGTFLMWADMESVTSGVANVTYDLLVDGVVVATTVAGTGGAGPAGPGSLSALVNLNRATTHQFAIRSTASAGTVNTPAQRAHITWLELGG